MVMGQNASTGSVGMGADVSGFAGQRFDPVMGGYHLGNGYRFYHPLLMRFTAPDSDSPFGVGMINPYVYCLDDPINSADPSGHFSVTPVENTLEKSSEILAVTSMEKTSQFEVGAVVKSLKKASSHHGVLGYLKNFFKKPDPIAEDYSAFGKFLSNHTKLVNGGEGVTYYRNSYEQVVQKVAPSDVVFGLRRNPNFPDKANLYELYNLKSGVTENFVPHGVYTFVIRADDPHVVRVAHNTHVEGHTSITRLPLNPSVDNTEIDPVDVRWGGHMRFFMGQLMGWDGYSGHYRPNESKKGVERAFTPLARRILPPGKRTTFSLDTF